MGAALAAYAKTGGKKLMRAVITVIGKDMVGILARVSAICAENDVNISDVTQSVLQDLFTMIMLVDISKCKIPLSELSDKLTAAGQGMNLTIHVMHEDIFNAMHKI
jgi:ACT domain-containing protein